MKKVLALVMALVLVLSLAACGGSNSGESKESKSSSSSESAVEQSSKLDPALSKVQDFACRYLTSVAAIFENPLSLEVKKAWCLDNSAGSLSAYYFTFQLDVDNSAGIKQTVYYGDKMFFSDLSDEEISLAKRALVQGNYTGYFQKDEIKAMQEGVELDAQAIQDYFLKNYRK